MRQKPVYENRLSDLGEQTYLSVFCGNPRCEKHHASIFLDIPATIERYGDLPLEGLEWRFRACPVCKHKPVGMRRGHKLPESKSDPWMAPGKRA